MTRSKFGIALLVFAATAAAQTNAWELGHPDAKLLLGIDLKSIRESAAWQLFRDQAKTQPPASGMQAIGMGILEQVNHIFVSSPANSTANAKTNPPFLLAVEGKFPIDQLKPFLQSAPRRFGTADIYRLSKTDSTTLAVMDGLLLLGDENSVLSAIDRRGHALLPASKLLVRAKALASTNDFWVIADESLSKFRPASATSNPLATQFASQIKGLDFGLAVREGFQFELSLATENDAAASQMAQMFATQIQLGLASEPNTPQAAEMVQKLKIDSLGNRVRVSLALSNEELAALLQAEQTARMQVAAAAPQTPRPAARPAKPGKIVIYGLDDGPREIQTTH